MYYLQSRYYDPAIGRFINADSFATTDAEGFLSCNMFAYCENDPINRSDPSGELLAEIIGGSIAGAAIGIASTFINAQINGKKVSGMDVVTGALRGALSGGIAGGFSVASFGIKVAGVAINGFAAAISAAANDGSVFDVISSAVSAMASTAAGYLYPGLGKASSALRTSYTAASGTIVGGITESLSSCTRAIFNRSSSNSSNPNHSAKSATSQSIRGRRQIVAYTR